MDRIAIRRLEPADRDLVLAAGDDVFDDAPRPAWTDAALADPAQRIVGAVTEGRLVGFAAGAVVRQPDKPPAFYVNELGVAEAFHRRGIGRAILRAMADEARAMGCTTLFVLAEADDARANAFYAAQGAEPIAATAWELAL